MLHIIADRLNEEHVAGYIGADGTLYNAARVSKAGELQLSTTGGASWVTVPDDIYLVCAMTGNRILFWRVVAEARLERMAEYYVYVAMFLLGLSIAGIIFS